MGTKEHPGAFDCYEAAEPDEPMFVLLARDEQAAQRVDEWAAERFAATARALAAGHAVTPNREMRKIAEALKCAQDMREWRAKKVRQEAIRASNVAEARRMASVPERAVTPVSAPMQAKISPDAQALLDATGREPLPLRYLAMQPSAARLELEQRAGERALERRPVGERIPKTAGRIRPQEPLVQASVDIHSMQQEP